MTRLLAVAVLALAFAAWADVPPPDISGCNGKAAGDACTRDDGSAGACAKATCSRNDYSNGPPPTSVSYECLRCEAGAAPAKKSSCASVPGVTVVGLLALVAGGRRLRASRASRPS